MGRSRDDQRGRIRRGTDLAMVGTRRSAPVTIAGNVPKIAAVTSRSRFVPRGLIGSGAGAATGTAGVVRWREVSR